MSLKVIIFSGLLSFFVPEYRAGTTDIASQLDSVPGIEANHYIYSQWKRAGRDLVKNIQPGDRVVIMGHSMGTDRGAELIDELKKRGVRVDLFVAFDPTLAPPTEIRDNVDHVIELRATSGIVEARRRFDKKKGIVTYQPGFAGRRELHIIDAGHVAITKNKRAQKIAIDAVRRLKNRSSRLTIFKVKPSK